VNDFIAVYDDSDDNPEYNLQLSIAKVLEINHATSELHVWWMYGTSWSGLWHEWKFKNTKQPYIQWIETSSIIAVNRKWLKLSLTKKSGHVPHSSKYCIDKKSIEDIVLVLSQQL
jgi:hypothetical protein